MEIVTSAEHIASLRDNSIIGNFDFAHSKVIFKGVDNVLIAKKSESQNKITLNKMTISFNGNNSVVFLGESDKDYKVNISCYSNSFVYIGSNNYFNATLQIVCSEQCNVLIGDDCLFSLGVWIRTSDAHLVYDIESRERINNSQSIFIGDHVWIGQDAKIWKGTHLGSGAILGAGAFSSGKHIPSNSAWGGNPARLIKHGVSFYGASTHPFTDRETKKWAKCPDDRYVYAFDADETLDLKKLEQDIQSLPTAVERAEFLLDFSRKVKKNRFYVKS